MGQLPIWRLLNVRGAARLGAVAGAVALLAGCGGLDRNGQFREDPLQGLEQKIVGGALVSAGLIAPPREKITYTPRAPLALPPPQTANKLPVPEDGTRVEASLANWPVDPDEVRKERVKRYADQRLAETRADPDGKRAGTPLTADEIAAGKSEASTGQDDQARIAASNFPTGKAVISREELEKGWSSPSAGSGWSLFEIDETVDVREKNRQEQVGQAKDYIDQQNGSNNTFEGKLDRVDTSKLANQAAPQRGSIIDPPIDVRAPAPDPTAGAAATVTNASGKDERAWWQRLFGG